MKGARMSTQVLGWPLQSRLLPHRPLPLTQPVYGTLHALQNGPNLRSRLARSERNPSKERVCILVLGRSSNAVDAKHRGVYAAMGSRDGVSLPLTGSSCGSLISLSSLSRMSPLSADEDNQCHQARTCCVLGKCREAASWGRLSHSAGESAQREERLVVRHLVVSTTKASTSRSKP